MIEKRTIQNHVFKIVNISVKKFIKFFNCVKKKYEKCGKFK